MGHYKTSVQQALLKGWQSPLGQHVLREEQNCLQSLNHYFYGYYQVQLGVADRMLPDITQPRVAVRMVPGADLEGDNESLPFKSHSLDTLLLVHVLEFSADPHQILREAERVLVADGILVICCFNPWSLWGLRRWLSWQDDFPWQGHFFSQTRIKDWLALLNFEVIETEKLLFIPPLSSATWLSRLTFLERWGKRLWPIFSGVTMMVSIKRTIPLTPVTQHKQHRIFFPTGRFVSKPASRERIENNAINE